MHMTVIIASLGRASELGQLSEHLKKQTRLPDDVVFSVVNEDDLPAPQNLYENSQIFFGPKGLPAQRNRGMEPVLKTTDIIVFFDDDYIPTPNVLERIEQFFSDNQDCVGVTGHLIADGINSSGISYEDAKRMVDDFNEDTDIEDITTKTLRGLYGCNMAYRVSAIQNARFDENLPLYAWQEDMDFASSVSVRGKLAKTTKFAGVHRGVKGARTRGVKLGYSQVANPLYLVRKGTMPRSLALMLISKNIIANHVKSIRPEPWVDRWGRTKGNWLALKETLLGRARPDRILDL